MTDEIGDILDRIARRVRFLRRTQALSQEELASSAGVSRNTIINVENLRHPPTIQLLAQIGKVTHTPLYLFFAPLGMWKDHLDKLTDVPYKDE